MLSNSILTSPGITPGGSMHNRSPFVNTDSLQTTQMSAAILNLPPLLKKPMTSSTTQHTLSGSDVYSSSDISGEPPNNTEEMPHNRKVSTNLRKMTKNDSASSSSSSLSTTANTTATSVAAATDNVTDLGRYCKGYAFEEIYSGKDTSFRYTGIIKGATYYFRIRCHNAAGLGLWSNTFKCNVFPAI